MAAHLTNLWLHPLWRVRWVAWRRRIGAIAMARRGHRGALAGVVLACFGYAVVVHWASHSGLMQRTADAPLVPAVLLFAFVHVVARAVVATSEREMRTGFTAALPVGGNVRRRTSLLLALITALVVRIPVDIAFAASGIDAPAMFDPATLLAVGSAWLMVRDWSNARRSHDNAALHQVPKLFFANLTPASRTFPHLPAWQRLRATAHWRTAGRAWQIGGIALLLPRNAGILILAMLVVLGTMLWWAVMARAAASVFADARALLAALHVDRARLAGESLRYPAAGSVIATLIVSLAMAAVI